MRGGVAVGLLPPLRRAHGFGHRAAVAGGVLILGDHAALVGALRQPARGIVLLRQTVARLADAGDAAVQPGLLDGVAAGQAVGGDDGRLRIAGVGHRGDLVRAAQHPALDGTALCVVAEAGVTLAALGGDAGQVVALAGVANQAGLGVVVLLDAHRTVVSENQIAVCVVAVLHRAAVRLHDPRQQLVGAVLEPQLPALRIGDRAQVAGLGQRALAAGQGVAVGEDQVAQRRIRAAQRDQPADAVELPHLAARIAQAPQHRECADHPLQHLVLGVLRAVAVVADGDEGLVVALRRHQRGRTRGRAVQALGEAVGPALRHAQGAADLVQRVITAGEAAAGELEVRLEPRLVAGGRVAGIAVGRTAGHLQHRAVDHALAAVAAECGQLDVVFAVAVAAGAAVVEPDRIGGADIAGLLVDHELQRGRASGTGPRGGVTPVAVVHGAVAPVTRGREAIDVAIGQRPFVHCGRGAEAAVRVCGLITVHQPGDRIAFVRAPAGVVTVGRRRAGRRSAGIPVGLDDGIARRIQRLGRKVGNVVGVPALAVHRGQRNAVAGRHCASAPPGTGSARSAASALLWASKHCGWPLAPV